MFDTAPLERRIGDTVQATAEYLFETLGIDADGIEVRKTLRPFYRDMALIYVDAVNASAVMADGSQPIGSEP